MVTVPVKQFGLRFELGSLNGKLGHRKLEEVVDYLLGKIYFLKNGEGDHSLNKDESKSEKVTLEIICALLSQVF